MSILITAANSAQAYQLKNILGAEAAILLGDYLEIPDLLVRSGKMIRTPAPQGNAFIHEMLALCLDKGVDKVFALRRSELLPLAEARQLFAEFDITLYIPEREMITEGKGHHVDGRVVIIENGRLAMGDIEENVNNALLQPGITGVFKVNNQDYTLFIAD